MSQQQDTIFFRNFTIVIACLGLLMGLFVFLGIFFSSHVNSAMSDTVVVDNTAPIGQVRIAGSESETPTSEDLQDASSEVATIEDIGKSTYDGLCFSCHGSGITLYPQVGDLAAWEERIAQGNEILYDHAINGYIGSSGIAMPAKGGNATLSDDMVKAAVDYMVQNSQ